LAGGYTGKYCIVNLSSGTTEVVRPADSFYQKYLSGYGLGAAVIMERQPPGVNPLSPQSHLGFCSGLITGSGALFSGRFMVVGKSPLTGGWGDANAGGYLSREIKRTGYDAVFLPVPHQNPSGSASPMKKLRSKMPAHCGAKTSWIPKPPSKPNWATPKFKWRASGQAAKNVP